MSGIRLVRLPQSVLIGLRSFWCSGKFNNVYPDALFTISADSAYDSTKGLSCSGRHQLASCPNGETSPGLYVRRAPRQERLCHREATGDPNPRAHRDPVLRIMVPGRFFSRTTKCGVACVLHLR